MIKFSRVLAVLLLSNQLLLAQSNDDIAALNLVQKGASLVQVSKQFTFTEGPAVDKKGNIFFTDQPNDKIWKYSADGKLSLFMDKTGRSNGLYFDKKGRLIACADEKNELWAIDKGKVSVLLDNIKGLKANGPNDLWIDPKGGIYFTDPYYQRDYWTRKKPEIDKQNVYYLAKGSKEVMLVDGDLKQPNGIVGTSDGKYLFVADIRDSKTYRYEIQADGTLANRQLFAPMGSDGMTLDNQGNLYLTGRGVTIYNKEGVKLGNIPVPSNWVGNICFGGKDRKTLFITASESIYTLQMQVKGVE
ncbi:SMP-30/gluconolactonase/LRE family protein [Arcicella lustrica]|uniref:SMP-30/gluconolactonase/LRE family protein n=1 Tax=Arcicella lustrica TaxID=2984196 RepID=A0ABU5SNI3_9BACT|nr:SMP-30/gluconolactonase/LRE family protein [Arcicella sp. DC25W]MEA5428841.1 SMP-30/gluconolactonase/LRE family protein [Arcicella sp. DC25W]